MDRDLSPNRPCFGKYKCPICKRSWMSENSWVGFAQKCSRCKIDVFPYIQTPLARSDQTDKKNTHMQDLCPKCISLGRFCGA